VAACVITLIQASVDRDPDGSSCNKDWLVTVTICRSQRKPFGKFARSFLTFSGEMYSASVSSVGLRSVLT